MIDWALMVGETAAGSRQREKKRQSGEPRKKSYPDRLYSRRCTSRESDRLSKDRLEPLDYPLERFYHIARAGAQCR